MELPILNMCQTNYFAIASAEWLVSQIVFAVSAYDSVI